MKPTPGPWETEVDSQRIDGIGAVRMHRVVAPNGAVVVEFSNTSCSDIVYEDDGDGLGCHYDIEAIANAQLIAAAPELYAALAEVIDIWEPYPGGSAEVAWKTAKAALAKARGEMTK